MAKYNNEQTYVQINNKTRNKIIQCELTEQKKIRIKLDIQYIITVNTICPSISGIDIKIETVNVQSD